MILLPPSDKGPLMSPNNQELNELDNIFYDPAYDGFTLDCTKPGIMPVPLKYATEAKMIFLGKIKITEMTKELRSYLGVEEWQPDDL
jgi:hypothetical protein